MPKTIQQVRRSSLTAVALLTTTLLCCAGRASAEQKPRTPAQTKRATEHAIEQAKTLFRQGRWQAAIDRLQRAKRAAAAGSVRAQLEFELGLIYAALQDERALDAFRGALRNDPNLTIDQNQLKPAVVELFRKARDTLRGTLNVRTTADLPRATVHVDGQALGKLPLRTSLAVGRHVVEVRSAKDTLIFRRETVVSADRTVTLDVEKPEQPAPAVTPFWGRSRLWTWITLGGAVAAAGSAVGFGLLSNAAQDEAYAAIAALQPAHRPQFRR